MISRYVFILILILSLLDAIALNGSFILTTIMGVGSPFKQEVNYTLLAFVNITWFGSAFFSKLYRYNSVQTFKKMCYKSKLTYCCHVVFLSIGVSKVSVLQTSEKFIFWMLLITLIAFIAIRIIIYATELHFVKLSNYKRRIAIVGDSYASEKLAKYFRQNGQAYNFAGHYRYVDGANLEHKLEDLKRDITSAINNRLDEVYTTILPEDSKELNEIITLAEQHCVRVMFINSNTTNLKYRINGNYNGVPVQAYRAEPLSILRNRILKRGFDVAFSVIIIVFLLSWLVPILALLIKLESPGPTFFLQLRSGRNNKPFWCFKFRSMHVNNNSDRLQATKNDSRVTRIGAFLRRTSIDELPQFFNVLIGNMSIVGPRPHMLKHTDEYREIIDQYMVRLFLKPGITGWAQINGYRGETRDYEQMRNRVEHDIWYMENWSIYEDARIIYKTVVNAVHGEENAY